VAFPGLAARCGAYRYATYYSSANGATAASEVAVGAVDPGPRNRRMVKMTRFSSRAGARVEH